MNEWLSRHEIDPRKALVFITVHVLGIAGLIYFSQNFQWNIMITTIVIFFIFHLGITVGAHRFATHQAFVVKEKHSWFARLLAIMFSGSFQGPLRWWVAKHLQHHGNEDEPGFDPHTPKDGFWHAHMLWLMRPDADKIPKKYDIATKGGTVRKDMILWQSKHHALLAILVGFVIPWLIGLWLGDGMAGLLFIGFTRQVFQWHVTWSVNSVGHSYGTSIDATARNFGWFLTPIFGILTVGEAHHANHHVSPKHWRLGRKQWQLDPGSWLIRFAEWCEWIEPLNNPPDRKRRTPKLTPA